MKIIRELTDNLSEPPNYNPALFVGRDFINMEVPTGKATSTGLWKDDDVAVARTVIEKDTKFGGHTHPETEYVIMVSGKLELIYDRADGPSEVLTETGFTVIKANRIHLARALDKCVVIVITIPASKGFPEDGRSK